LPPVNIKSGVPPKVQPGLLAGPPVSRRIYLGEPLRTHPQFLRGKWDGKEGAQEFFPSSPFPPRHTGLPCHHRLLRGLVTRLMNNAGQCFGAVLTRGSFLGASGQPSSLPTGFGPPPDSRQPRAEATAHMRPPLQSGPHIHPSVPQPQVSWRSQVFTRNENLPIRSEIRAMIV
jgi:hypothetical protein